MSISVTYISGVMTVAVALLNLSFNRCVGHEEIEETPRVLFISLDGFRYDYLDIVKRHGVTTPTFDGLIAEGVTVSSPGVKNAFVTKTLPDHYTLVTGLYEESHGIVGNDFYDPVFKQTFIPVHAPSISTDIKWWNGTGSQAVVPIWVSNEQADRHSRRSGACMYWGCDVIGQTPTFYRSYNRTVPFKSRADDIISWFTHETKPINFGLLYMNEPDHTGHVFGPESKELTDKVAELDGNLKYLLDKLESHKLMHGLNIILTSDHGMEPVKRNIFLDDYLNSSLYTSSGGSPIRHVVPNRGQEDEVYRQLLKLEQSEHVRIVNTSDIAEEFHYKHNRRIGPYVIFADVGFQICDDHKCGKTLNISADHGWDNSMPSMHPIFIARGPAFKKKYIATPFETVNIYALLCHLLDIEPRPNNGTLDAVKHILADDDNLNLTMITFVLSIGLAALISGIWCIGACRSQRYSRRARVDTGTWKQHMHMGTLPTNSNSDGSKPLLEEEEEDLA